MYGMVTANIWFKDMTEDFIFLRQGVSKDERLGGVLWL